MKSLEKRITHLEAHPSNQMAAMPSWCAAVMSDPAVGGLLLAAAALDNKEAAATLQERFGAEAGPMILEFAEARREMLEKDDC